MASSSLLPGTMWDEAMVSPHTKPKAAGQHSMDCNHPQSGLRTLRSSSVGWSPNECCTYDCDKGHDYDYPKTACDHAGELPVTLTLVGSARLLGKSLPCDN